MLNKNKTSLNHLKLCNCYLPVKYNSITIMKTQVINLSIIDNFLKIYLLFSFSWIENYPVHVHRENLIHSQNYSKIEISLKLIKLFKDLINICNYKLKKKISSEYMYVTKHAKLKILFFNTFILLGQFGMLKV